MIYAMIITKHCQLTPLWPKYNKKIAFPINN